MGIVALGLAAVAWARRFFATELAARAAVVVLSLFFCTPLAALFSWTQSGVGLVSLPAVPARRRAPGRRQAVGVRTQRASALALVPVALLADRAGAATPDRRRRAALPPSLRGAIRSRRGPLIVAALASLLASWLHPWQGITLGLIYVGLAVLRRLRQLGGAGGAGDRRRHCRSLYYYLLSHHDHAWKLASQYEVIARLSADRPARRLRARWR